MNYSNTSNPVSPSDVTLRDFTLSATTALVWPFAGLDTPDYIARIMVISASSAGLALKLPPANQGSIGYDTIIINTGSESFSIQDNSGGAIDVVGPSQVKVVALRSGASAAGTWLSFTLGATTSAANAAALAGAGLTTIAQTLNSNVPATNFSASQSFGVGARASLYVWGGGAGIATIGLSSTLTNGWWMGFRNAGSGALTLTPTAPNLIDGESTQVLNPGDACLVFSTSGALYTVGIGRSVTITDTQLTKNVAGNVDVTLTPTEYGNNVINLIGVLTGNINVILPTAVKNYYVRNNTSGAFTLKCKTSAGTGVFIPQGGASIITADGTNVDAANTSSAGTVTSITAGTGLTGGAITGSGTIALADTAVSAGVYGDATNYPVFTVDAQGRMTNAGSFAIPNTLKNRIINGDMKIDQRNVGGAYTIPSPLPTYGSSDRYFSLSAGANRTVTRVSTADLDFPFAARVQRTAGADVSSIYFGQVIETINCEDLAGKTVTLSFYGKKGANYSSLGNALSVELWTGSGSNEGSASLNAATWAAQAATINTIATLTGVRQLFSYQGTIPAGTKEIAFRCWYTPSGAAGANDWFEITGVQLEDNTLATQFERLPYTMDLERCQRYYAKTINQTAAAAAPAALSGSLVSTSSGTTVAAVNVNWQFPVVMRASPTLVTYNPLSANNNWRDATDATDHPASVNNIGDSRTQIINSAVVTDQHNFYIHASASAEL